MNNRKQTEVPRMNRKIEWHEMEIEKYEILQRVNNIIYVDYVPVTFAESKSVRVSEQNMEFLDSMVFVLNTLIQEDHTNEFFKVFFSVHTWKDEPNEENVKQALDMLVNNMNLSYAVCRTSLKLIESISSEPIIGTLPKNVGRMMDMTNLIVYMCMMYTMFGDWMNNPEFGKMLTLKTVDRFKTKINTQRLSLEFTDEEYVKALNVDQYYTSFKNIIRYIKPTGSNNFIKLMVEVNKSIIKYAKGILAMQSVSNPNSIISERDSESSIIFDTDATEKVIAEGIKTTQEVIKQASNYLYREFDSSVPAFAKVKAERDRRLAENKDILDKHKTATEASAKESIKKFKNSK